MQKWKGIGSYHDTRLMNGLSTTSELPTLFDCLLALASVRDPSSLISVAGSCLSVILLLGAVLDVSRTLSMLHSTLVINIRGGSGNGGMHTSEYPSIRFSIK